MTTEIIVELVTTWLMRHTLRPILLYIRVMEAFLFSKPESSTAALPTLLCCSRMEIDATFP